MNPFFSIVIPTYNRGYIIQETIEKILLQTFSDFEILVVDDGSKDNTRQIVDELKLKDSRINYLYKENGERGAARNHGLQHAKGKYVVFFDSDDIMLPNHLKTLYNKIKDLGEDVHFIATKFNFTDEAQKTAPSAIQPFSEGWYDYKTFLNGNHLACNFCIKKDNPHLIPFENDRSFAILEDWMFLIENLRNDKLYLIDILTIQMRKHDDRSMGSHQVIIERRIRANETLLKRVDLSDNEKNYVTAHSYYFCAIHAYLDGDKKQAVILLRNAIAHGGLEIKFIVLSIKILIGKKVIDFVKGE